ncbi:MAG TPA: cell division protein FtsQ/DivIB [Thermoleophilaceae bacterium]|nr:cell division protein FtsQ/DivIB [Thermoleophilaceae bacterium]
MRAAAAATLRLPVAVLRAPSARVRRRLLVAALLAAVVGAGYLFWFRDSSFVRIERVSVTGLTGTDASGERAALVAAARRMTTLHVDQAALRRALGTTSAVEAIRVTTEFPHGLRIQVVEKAPVAVLAYGNERVAVGSGGVLLPDVEPIPRDLPAIDVGALPSGMRLGAGRASRLVAAAAAAPRALLERVERLSEVPGRGLVAYMTDGPDVILGSAAQLDAKWTAAAAILADETSSGAEYVDVRLPDRPVAGGLDLPPPAPDEQPGAADAPAPVPTPGATNTTTPGSTVSPGTTTTPGTTPTTPVSPATP